VSSWVLVCYAPAPALDKEERAALAAGLQSDELTLLLGPI